MAWAKGTGRFSGPPGQFRSTDVTTQTPKNILEKAAVKTISGYRTTITDTQKVTLLDLCGIQLATTTGGAMGSSGISRREDARGQVKAALRIARCCNIKLTIKLSFVLMYKFYAKKNETMSMEASFGMSDDEETESQERLKNPEPAPVVQTRSKRPTQKVAEEVASRTRKRTRQEEETPQEPSTSSFLSAMLTTCEDTNAKVQAILENQDRLAGERLVLKTRAAALERNLSSLTISSANGTSTAANCSFKD